MNITERELKDKVLNRDTDPKITKLLIAVWNAQIEYEEARDRFNEVCNKLNEQGINYLKEI